MTKSSNFLDLFQVSEGLSFLHGSGRMLHRNLSPESILINSQGAWKISGFEYCLSKLNNFSIYFFFLTDKRQNGRTNWTHIFCGPYT